MKKIIALVLCLVMVFALCACGESNTATTAPAADTATEAPAEEPAAAGSVYYLNFKPESDEAWQALAETYTKQTGVPVTVVTAASGTYDQTLTSEMDKSEAPTMFQVGNPGAVATWGEYCLDLTGTDVYNEMTTHAFDQVGDHLARNPGVAADDYGKFFARLTAGGQTGVGRGELHHVGRRQVPGLGPSHGAPDAGNGFNQCHISRL